MKYIYKAVSNFRPRPHRHKFSVVESCSFRYQRTLIFRFFFIEKKIYISGFEFPWIDVILVVFILFKGRNGLENLTKNPTLYGKEWQQQKEVVRKERTRKL